MLAHGSGEVERAVQKLIRNSIAKGRSEGLAEGQARSIVRFLEARGLTLSQAQREQILSTSDLATLDRWIDKVASITSVDQLFA